MVSRSTQKITRVEFHLGQPEIARAIEDYVRKQAEDLHGFDIGRIVLQDSEGIEQDIEACLIEFDKIER